jgi:hypothetical protein
MQMQLGVADRLLILGMMPGKGSFVTWKTIHAIKEKVSFDADEVKRFCLIDVPGGASWDPDKEASVDVLPPFSDGELEFIRGQMAVLDEKEELMEAHLDLHERLFKNPPDS